MPFEPQASTRSCGTAVIQARRCFTRRVSSMGVSLVEARRTPGTLRLRVSDLGDTRGAQVLAEVCYQKAASPLLHTCTRAVRGVGRVGFAGRLWVGYLRSSDLSWDCMHPKPKRSFAPMHVNTPDSNTYPTATRLKQPTLRQSTLTLMMHASSLHKTAYVQSPQP